MEIVRLQDAPGVQSVRGGSIMFSGDRTDVVHLELMPGEELSPHKNPYDVIFFCLQGEAKLTAENNVFAFQQDSCIMIPATCERALVNNTGRLFRMLVIKQKP